MRIPFVTRLAAFAVLVPATLAVAAAGRLTFDEAQAKPPGRYALADAPYRVEALPETVEAFTALRDRIARDPRGAYAAFVVAMQLYVKDKTLGLKCLTLVIDREQLMRDTRHPANVQGFMPSSSAQQYIRALDTRPYLPGVYFMDTKVEEAYRFQFPAALDFRQLTVINAGECKLFAATTSGNVPRPVHLRRNDKGIWKATEFSSMFVGVSKIPKRVVKDDL